MNLLNIINVKMSRAIQLLINTQFENIDLLFYKQLAKLVFFFIFTCKSL